MADTCECEGVGECAVCLEAEESKRYALIDYQRIKNKCGLCGTPTEAKFCSDKCEAQDRAITKADCAD